MDDTTTLTTEELRRISNEAARSLAMTVGGSWCGKRSAAEIQTSFCGAEAWVQPSGEVHAVIMHTPQCVKAILDQSLCSARFLVGALPDVVEALGLTHFLRLYQQRNQT